MLVCEYCGDRITQEEFINARAAIGTWAGQRAGFFHDLAIVAGEYQTTYRDVQVLLTLAQKAFYDHQHEEGEE